jgi:hypothetical protein
MEKAIQHGKEKRCPYHGAKAIAKSCRNHGGCPYCRGNRLYQNTKELQKMLDKSKEMWYNKDS